MLNILTRTSNRPDEFERLYQSIKNQKNNTLIYKHIVCYENDEDINYLSKYDDIEIFRVNRKEIYVKYKDKGFNLDHNNPNCFIHNLYMNELMDKVDEGFIIFIDDDDYLYNDDVFDDIEKILKDIDVDTLAVVQMAHPNTRKLPHKSFIERKEIRQGEIGTPCVIFNSKYVSHELRWEGWRAHDYHFIVKLNQMIPKSKWYEKTIVQIPSMGNQYEKLKPLD